MEEFDQERALTVMQNFFRSRATKPQPFATLRPIDLLQNSLQLIEFLLYVEENLGIELEATALGDELLSETFASLAGRLTRFSEQKPGSHADDPPAAAV